MTATRRRQSPGPGRLIANEAKTQNPRQLRLPGVFIGLELSHLDARHESGFNGGLRASPFLLLPPTICGGLLLAVRE